MTQTESETPRRHRPRFRPDAASIAAGLVFIGIGTVYLVSDTGGVQHAARWTGSVLVLGLGLAWVIGAITRRRR